MILLNKLQTPIPPELEEDFCRTQLQNNLYRFKISSITLQVVCLVFLSKEIFSLRERASVTPIIAYSILFIICTIYQYLSNYFSNKDDNVKQQWILCYSFAICFCCLMVAAINTNDSNNAILFSFIHRVYLISLVPDFKPKQTIPLLILFSVGTGCIMYGGKLDEEIFVGIATIFEFLVIAIITNLILYNRNVNIFTKTTELNKLNQNLSALSITDELTKLPNRRAFLERIGILWVQSKRLRVPINLLMIDVDYFKKYNDSMGHLEGDRVLIAIAQCMRDKLKRETDFVARFGGEEFVCILPYIDKEEALAFAKILLQSIEDMKIHHPMSEHSKYVTVSVGLSCTVPTGNDTYTQSLDKADKALYVAKESGRNRVIIY